MRSLDEWLRAIGSQVRAHRIAGRLTQAELASRAGLGGKYVSEIERGTRDVPISTLRALVDGLGLQLELDFRPKTGPSLPRAIEALAHRLASVSPELTSRLLTIFASIVELTDE